MYVRKPTFMGSWYSTKILRKEIESFLSSVNHKHSKDNVRALIVPHAGYFYSGKTAAFSYDLIDKARVFAKYNIRRRIFIFAPLHHIRTQGCLLTQCSAYKTQFYDLTVDQASLDSFVTVVKEIASSGTFQMLPIEADQDEHSGELQLNYIAHVMEGVPFTIVPIYIGRLNQYDKHHYSKILGPYLVDPQNLFVISSDFCHYGENFNYEPFNDKNNIDECIRQLDSEAIDAINVLSLAKFERHLSDTQNTICGRYPISLFLSMIDHLIQEKLLEKNQVSSTFLSYTRSKSFHRLGDSSVGYAAISFQIS